jgi:hypothetical protein
VRCVPRLSNEQQLQLSLKMAVRKVEGSCEMAARLGVSEFEQ